MHLDFRTEPGRLIEIKAIRKHLGTVHVLTEQYQPSKSQRSDTYTSTLCKALEKLLGWI